MAEKANTPEAPAPTAKPKSEGITKVEAVHQALKKLGNSASRVELQSYVKQHFGYEMTTDHISNCKHELQKKFGKPKGKSPAKTAANTSPSAPPAVAKAAAPKAAPPKTGVKAASLSNISLNDIQTAKELVGRVGPDQLRSLVDLLVK